MKEIPLLMSAPMVLGALREIDPKTQTRRTRALEHFSENDPDNWRCVRQDGDMFFFVYKNSPVERAVKCPYGQRGDRLWIKETWRVPSELDALSPRAIGEKSIDAGYREPWAPIQYEADGRRRDWSRKWTEPGKTRVSIHMPRWASRILLEVTGVRVERLQDITEADAIAEGIERDCGMWRHYGTSGMAFIHPVDSYRSLWESINGAGSWDANPWVWVIEFRRIEA